MVDTTTLILRIIENPFVKKGYSDLKKHYELMGLLNESEAIGDLIEKRFPKNNNTSTS